jgi:hypothetical protein
MSSDEVDGQSARKVMGPGYQTSGLRRTGTVISYYRFHYVLLKRGVQGESDSVSMNEK